MLCARCQRAADDPDAATSPQLASQTPTETCSSCGDPLEPTLPIAPSGDGSALSADATSAWPGRVLSGYRILNKLGAGGMGMVFLAEQLGFDRKVAIKVLPGGGNRHPELTARFEREAKALAALEHPHVVPVHAIFQADGLTCLVMGYAEGGSLRDLLRRSGPLPEAQAARLIRQAALGLHAAAQQGIIHRDVKPHNLLLNRRGEVKVADFGLARQGTPDIELTQEGAALGTPAYMAPEQWDDSRNADARSDLYALGITLYQLLVGQVPFTGPSVTNFVKQHMLEAPDLECMRATVSPAMLAVVQRLLEKDPGARYPSGAALAQALADLAAGAGPLPVEAGEASGPSPAGSPGSKPAARPDGVLWPWVGVACVLVAAALLWWALEGPAPTAAEPWWQPTQAQLDAATKSGRPLVLDSQGMRLVLVPAGEFLMGSPPEEKGRVRNETQHPVRISRPFYLGATEVEQACFERVMGYQPSRFAGDERMPVESVSWLEAARFCNALSLAEGLEPAYRIAGDSVELLGLDRAGYRLPSEAEWEYACRAGSTGELYTDQPITLLGAHHSRELDALAWYGGNSGVAAERASECNAIDARDWIETQERFDWARTQPVGQKQANAWGLYDMLGNVYEYCHDWFANDSYGERAVTDPIGAAHGDKRVLRGGGFAAGVRDCRVARRGSTEPLSGGWGIGFRVARGLGPTP